jgi:signal transduction histidine kinase
VRVADNGIGMSPLELERAFERFYQASASIEGSGVGLSLCRSMIEGMGGTIALASPGRGGGLTATLTLPG